MSCLWDRAGELHRANKFLEALELYTEILAYDPLDIKARNNRACVYDDLDRYKEALHDLNIAIALCPEDGGVYAYNYRGYINIKLDRYEEALHDLNMAIALCPEDGNAYAYNCRGYINIKMKHYKQALDDYRISLKLTYPEYNPNKLIGLIHKNQLDKGIIILKYLLNNGFYVYLKGNIREKMIIMRRISDDRIVLSLNNDKLHIGKTIRRHIRQHGSKYELRFDSESDFEVIFNRCIIKYKGKSDVLYLEMLHHFFSAIKQSNDSPKAITTALYKDGVLVAGDVAVQIGRVFSSYTAFHDEAHTGNILFILLAKYLKEKGYALWDLGPTYGRFDIYKIRFGAEKLREKEYISLFNTVNPELNKIFKIKEKSGKAAPDNRYPSWAAPNWSSYADRIAAMDYQGGIGEKI